LHPPVVLPRSLSIRLGLNLGVILDWDVAEMRRAQIWGELPGYVFPSVEEMELCWQGKRKLVKNGE
jgi:hypothetical protein